MISLDRRPDTTVRPRDTPASPLRIAIVGCGPKGLFCLQQLATQLKCVATRNPLSVTIFEPADFPGAGVVYDPRQPHYLRMNFSAEHISVEPNAGRLPTLLQWLQFHHPDLARAGQFAPRALVGKYLHDCYLETAKHLREHAHLTRVKEQVVDLLETGSGWRVVTDRRSSVREFDEVLLAVGHEGWRTSEADERQAGTFDIPRVYPTDTQLSSATAPAGSHIALRGIGLTAIDAILALTEGRGGTFRQTNHAFAYERQDTEPAAIYPYSRSGRPMLAKPNPLKMSLPDLEGTWQRYTADLAKLGARDRPLQFREGIWPVIESAAESALRAAGGSGAAAWLRARLHHYPGAGEFRNEIASSVEVATGKSRPDAAWAVGEAWRRLYPTLVELVSHDGLTVDSWPHFRASAAEMERIAFGPPVESCRKLISIIDSGLVNLRFLQGAVATCDSGARELRTIDGRRAVSIDCHINAVLPGPAASDPRGPLNTLTQRGNLVPHASGCGYRIDRSGRPITEEGRPLCGVSLVGRPTEGAVLGNDTLNPRLHDGPSCWASNIVEQLRRTNRSKR